MFLNRGFISLLLFSSYVIKIILFELFFTKKISMVGMD
jgi:hypothetical protein